jgi:hypothetical protein
VERNCLIRLAAIVGPLIGLVLTLLQLAEKVGPASQPQPKNNCAAAKHAGG